MANFNTVAGCFLASALFAMVVGKVSNALVSSHPLEKPAIAVADAPPETASAAPASPTGRVTAVLQPKSTASVAEPGKASPALRCPPPPSAAK